MAFDLDAAAKSRAAKREGADQGWQLITYKGTQFALPGELPMTILDRLLDPDLELGALIAGAINAARSGEQDAMKPITDMLVMRPDLPRSVLAAIYRVIQDIFGQQQWEAFRALQPSLNDVVTLSGHLFRSYGVGLGEAFGSSPSAGTDGATSKPISNVTTDLTPASSGPIPVAPIAPVPVGSVPGV